MFNLVLISVLGFIFGFTLGEYIREYYRLRSKFKGDEGFDSYYKMLKFHLKVMGVLIGRLNI